VEALLDDLGVDNVVVVTSDDPAGGHPSQAPFEVILVVGSVPSVPPARRRPHRGRARRRPDRQGHPVHQAARRGRPARDMRCSDASMPRAPTESAVCVLDRIKGFGCAPQAGAAAWCRHPGATAPLRAWA
jgi:hypothetical protein